MRNKWLDICYHSYNAREFVKSDPVQVLYHFEDPLEREVAVLLTSSIAYGRVKSILNSVHTLLGRLGWKPHAFLSGASSGEIKKLCKGFRHRFTGPEAMFQLLEGTSRLLRNYGSLEAFSRSRCVENELTYAGIISDLVTEIAGQPDGIPHLLPSPAGNSACKRLCLFFRWMVRRDEIDPGGWDRLDPAGLIIPLDVHMLRNCQKLGIISHRTPSWHAALSVTETFRRFSPHDPVKYDFAMTRASMFDDPILNHIRTEFR